MTTKATPKKRAPVKKKATEKKQAAAPVKTTVPAIPRDPNPVVARATEGIVERLMTLNRVLDIHLPEQTEEIWHFAVQLENEAAVNMAKRGFIYLMLKERLPHGEFIKGLENIGVAARRARYAMTVAQMLTALPPAKTKSLIHIAGSKLIELARIPIETLEELTGSGELNLDEVDTMSVRELKAEVRKLKSDVVKEQALRENTEMDLEELHLQIDAGEKHKGEWPATVARARLESSALTDQSLTCIDDMEQLFEALLTGDDLPHNDPAKLDMYVGAGASTLFVNLQAIQAKTHRLLGLLISNTSETDLPTGAEEMPLLSDEEIQAIISQRSTMLAIHRAGADARENARQSSGAIKRKRGRPAGSKSKPKGAAK